MFFYKKRLIIEQKRQKGGKMKILTNTSIPLNNEKQEFSETEKDTFDLLMVNDGDIHDFFAGYIPTHWHNELEFFVLLY